MKKIVSGVAAELGNLVKDTLKTTVIEIANAFTPIEIINGNLNHTPLDSQRLNEAYRKNDEIRYKQIKQRLLNQMREEEQRVRIKKQQEIKQKLQEEQLREEKSEPQQFTPLEIPRGKQRRSIFERVIKKKYSEFRAGKGRG